MEHPEASASRNDQSNPLLQAIQLLGQQMALQNQQLTAQLSMIATAIAGRPVAPTPTPAPITSMSSVPGIIGAVTGIPPATVQGKGFTAAAGPSFLGSNSTEGTNCSGSHSDGNDEFLWDDDGKSLSIKFNDSVRFVNDRPALESPSVVLDALRTRADDDFMESLTPQEIAHLHISYSFGASMLTKFIVEKHLKEVSSSKSKNKTIRKMGRALSVTKKQLESALKQVSSEQDRHKAEVDQFLELQEKSIQEKKALQKEIDRLRSEQASSKKHLKDLEGRFVNERMSWGSEKSKLNNLVKDLQSQLSTPPASVSPVMSAEVIINQYKASDDFQLDNLVYLEQGFNVCKKVLVKDGLIDQSSSEKYNHLDALLRHEAGDLD